MIDNLKLRLVELGNDVTIDGIYRNIMVVAYASQIRSFAATAVKRKCARTLAVIIRFKLLIECVEDASLWLNLEC